ncbi:tetratricopeptide repeat protein [Magnetospirillum sp. UT-4]|uniref:tetratricopeptide repeat protein n=1 Tax=Magnetospirillum sp. UT-4 TaxID=2681467 RepID=UPI00137E11EA|nr:tetratricopeptide repeat protein [Magnetospirillum sp. UT-4]CAA7618691.1 hypothetical protein MTBUT4_30156 [Magnetospirillum sp. UT-4]
MAGPGGRERLFAEGVAHAKAGRHDRALALFEKVRRQRPDAAVLNAIAITLKAMGDPAGARAAYDRALALAPTNPDLLYNLAKLEMDNRRPAAAAALLRRALAIRAHPSYFRNLGVCCLDLEESRAAVDAFAAAARLTPKDPVPWSYVGAAWQQVGDLKQAEKAHAKALALQPDNPEILNNLGSTRLLQRRLDEAEAAFRRAIAVWPDYAEAHYGLAWTLLHQRHFTEGWAEWEWRLKRRRFAEPPATAPLWDGTPFKGTLLVHREIGFGDSINFARFLPRAAERCDKVVFACQPPLVELLAASLPGIEVVRDDRKLPAADRFAYVMSLPGFFVGCDDHMVAAPYLAPPPGRFTRVEGGGPRIGLCWSSTRKGLDPHRFLPAAMFAEAVVEGIDGARFFSLQKGLSEEEKAPVTRLAMDLEPHLADFADTAAAIAALDLVVTVDTAVAHLAGALGVPSLMMLHHGADWRWFDGDTCPWYAQARLFRQPAPGDWPPLLRQVRTALQGWLKNSPPLDGEGWSRKPRRRRGSPPTPTLPHEGGGGDEETTLPHAGGGGNTK